MVFTLRQRVVHPLNKAKAPQCNSTINSQPLHIVTTVHTFRTLYLAVVAKKEKVATF